MKPERPGTRASQLLSRTNRDEAVATRKAYGNALKRLYPAFPDMVVLDGEVSNSTYAEIFEEAYPERYFEMYIAEQNMVGTAVGLCARGKAAFRLDLCRLLYQGLRPDTDEPVLGREYQVLRFPRGGLHRRGRPVPDGPRRHRHVQEHHRTASSFIRPTRSLPRNWWSRRRGCKGIVYIRTTRGATP